MRFPGKLALVSVLVLTALLAIPPAASFHAGGALRRCP